VLCYAVGGRRRRRRRRRLLPPRLTRQHAQQRPLGVSVVARRFFSVTRLPIAQARSPVLPPPFENVPGKRLTLRAVKEESVTSPTSLR